MPPTLFDEIVDKDNFYKAYKQTRKGKGKYSPAAILFAKDETSNLEKLRQSLIDETYEFGGYFEFPVFEPKPRIINAPTYKDKIVQIAINNVLKGVCYPCFIYDSYSCIDGKGTHRCAKRIQHFLRKAKWMYGEGAFIIKIDIRKFFYTIDRDILEYEFAKKIKCAKSLRLICKIIDSAATISPLGLPLGNTLSQISSNLYMNRVDQYAKRKLRLKFHLRYADDIIVVVENRDRAKNVLHLMISFIKRELRLDINEGKTKIFPINQGVNAIGYKIHTTHMLLRNDSKKKIKRKAKKMRGLLRDKSMAPIKAEQILNSWKGHADHGNSRNFIKKLIESNDYIYMNRKGVLKVNMRAVMKGDVDHSG